MANSCINGFARMIVKNQYVFQLHHSSLFYSGNGGERTHRQSQKVVCCITAYSWSSLQFLCQKRWPPHPALCSLFPPVIFWVNVLSLVLQNSKGPICSCLPSILVWFPSFAPKFLDPSSFFFSWFVSPIQSSHVSFFLHTIPMPSFHFHSWKQLSSITHFTLL